MKTKILLAFIFTSSFFCANAQTVRQEKYESEDAQEQQEYEHEFTYGINWNTNGGIIGGIDFKYAWQTKKSQLVYNLIGLEIGHVVHPKERFIPGASQYGSSYVYGKSNNMFVIRPHFGREWIIFRKAEEEGIQVSGIVAGGPSLAYLKPYYVTYANLIYHGDTIVDIKYHDQQFDPNLNEPIAGASSIFSGFDQMKAYLGVHVKASLCFEYGKNGGSVGGIEIGTLLEQYASKLIIIPEAENRSFYSSVFINVYFGIR